MRTLVCATLALGCSLATASASARDPATAAAPAAASTAAPTAHAPDVIPVEDGPRFRGGIAIEGGAIIVPDAGTAGVSGVRGQLGVQINDLVGIYVAPFFDIMFGDVEGISLGSALMVDFTLLDNLLTFGGGAAVGAFLGLGGSSYGDDVSLSGLAGSGIGGRIRAAVNPIVARGVDGVRRKALTVAASIDVLNGLGLGGTISTNGSASGGASNFVLSPALSIAYQAF